MKYAAGTGKEILNLQKLKDKYPESLQLFKGRRKCIVQNKNGGIAVSEEILCPQY